MPYLSAFYGLRWEHIEVMPYDELSEYLRQLPNVRRLLAQSEFVKFKD